MLKKFDSELTAVCVHGEGIGKPKNHCRSNRSADWQSSWDVHCASLLVSCPKKAQKSLLSTQDKETIEKLIADSQEHLLDIRPLREIALKYLTTCMKSSCHPEKHLPWLNYSGAFSRGSLVVKALPRFRRRGLLLGERRDLDSHGPDGSSRLRLLDSLNKLAAHKSRSTMMRPPKTGSIVTPDSPSRVLGS